MSSDQQSWIATHDPTQTDVLHPRHGDGLREAASVAGLVFIVGVALILTGSLGFISDGLAVFLTLILSVGAGFGVRHLFCSFRGRALQTGETQ
ncbi:hypothetical protein JJJ17_14910 [Paracoccus caeni]|uniref:Uncharacterized protein n=1 Tax=Paracoccus caeni TaxID=657651 RepID=A0A934SE65_9RHOB|nr:hypothetical protein [Paracoccus caeni]MBK4217220.1 hypothetical protein [Paracoccus caeni]